MSQPMADAARSAASVLFNLPEYDVIEVARDEAGGRRVVISTPVREAACPGCGVLTARVHQRTTQRVRDVGFDGLIEVVWLKKRWRCVEDPLREEDVHRAHHPGPDQGQADDPAEGGDHHSGGRRGPCGRPGRVPVRGVLAHGATPDHRRSTVAGGPAPTTTPTGRPARHR